VKLTLDDICCAAYNEHRYVDVDRTELSLRNQLRKGWDARVAVMRKRCFDIQDELDEDYDQKWIEILEIKYKRNSRRTVQAIKLVNPWK